MMFSFPEYLGANTEAGLKTGFQWLTILFSLPVVFFLSTDFFKSAWAGIRSGQVNIDQPIALGIVALWTRSLWEVVSGIGPGYLIHWRVVVLPAHRPLVPGTHLSRIAFRQGFGGFPSIGRSAKNKDR
ncbi:MAG: hypothetical protein IPP33_08435 [Flavobacteriales bacterium]|nr:hypothetical protein [Flavobacteriales bacterium]